MFLEGAHWGSGKESLQGLVPLFLHTTGLFPMASGNERHLWNWQFPSLPFSLLAGI